MTKPRNASIFFKKLVWTQIVLLLLGNSIFAQNQCLFEPELKVINASLGSSLNGPFMPNEELTIQLNIAWLGIDCNWIHGLVPTYGSAWSVSNFSANVEIVVDYPLNDFSGNFFWYADHNIRYKNYESAQYEFDDLLPPGWFVTSTTNGSSPICGSNQYLYDPNCSCGIPQGCGSVRDYTMIFKLTTQSYEECIASGSTDLSLQFKLFSDYESGSGPSNACIDVPIISQNWALSCTDDLSLNIFPAEIFVPNNEPFEVDIAEYLVVPQNNNYTYTWEPVTSWAIEGGTSCDQNCGTIFSQTLTNISATAKEQKYLVKAIDESGVEGPATQWTIKVAASLSNHMNASQTACSNNEFTIPIHILGGAANGASNGYEYLWSTGETTQHISVLVDEPTTYTVTVTDEWETRIFTYFIDVVDPPQAEIAMDAADDPCSGMSPVALSYINPLENLVYTWSGPGVTTESQNDSIIYPTATGVYELTINDWSTGCTNTYEMVVHNASNIAIDLSISQQQVCRSFQSLDLFMATPAGGELSGHLDANNHFIPDEVGVYTITYTYVDPISQCVFEVSAEIEVIDSDLPAMTWAHETPSAYCVGETYTFCIDDVALPHSKIWQTSDETAIIESISENCVLITWETSSETNTVCVEYYTDENCWSPKLCTENIEVLNEVNCFSVDVEDLIPVFNVYPNPTYGLLNIESSKHIKNIQVVDLMGRIIFEKSADSAPFHQLDISEIEMGVYQLVVDGISVDKLVVY